MLSSRRLAAAVLILSTAGIASGTAEGRTLRVCADPNNLPFSNAKQQGFENELAELVAEDLDAGLEYFWWPQRRGFLRKTLKAGECDIVMGVPQDYEMLATSQPYYKSTYVFVSRADRDIDVHSMQDPRLEDLKIGVNLIGDDGNNTPPAHALSNQGLQDNLAGFMIYGDYSDPAPLAQTVRAVADGEIDLAAIWGPTAGYFAQRSQVPLHIAPVTDTEAFRNLRFAFAISMGVRKGEDAFLGEINQIIERRQGEIENILKDYSVPMPPVQTTARAAP